MEQGRENGSLFYALQRLSSDTHKHIDQMLLERLGIGVSQLRILHIVQSLESAGQRTIGDALGQTEASISRQVKVLAQKGLVQVQINPKNQRQKLVSITIKGARLAEAADADLDRGMQAILQPLSAKQRKQFIELLNMLRK
ncbi:MAG TPA: MarR family transcriptional regulator [Candidatus Saccharimonadales bacterium]|nr:MarR family transcriptional regulator [Candidatus Saccharimonadales bacterium]